MTKLIITLLLVPTMGLALGTVVTSAHAQTEDAPDERRDREARAHFDAARLAYEDGRFEEAMNSFLRSFELSQRVTLHYNIAAAAERAGNLELAQRHYQLYLEALPDASNRSYTEARLRVIGETLSRQRELEAAAQAARDPAQSTDAQQVTVPPDAGEAAPSDGATPVGAVVLIGAAGGALVASLGLGLRARSIHSNLEASCPDGRCSPDREPTANRMARLAHTSDAMLGVGLAAGVAGVVWAVLAGRDGAADEVPPVAVSCGRSGCAVTGQLRF